MKPKKKSMRMPLVLLFLTLLMMFVWIAPSPAFAQMDPAMETLLGPASKSLSEEQKAGLQSGRYEIRSNREPADANVREATTTTTTSGAQDSNQDFTIQLKKKKPARKKQAAKSLPSKKVMTDEKSMEPDSNVHTVVTASTMPVIPQPSRPLLVPSTTTTTVPPAAKMTEQTAIQPVAPSESKIMPPSQPPWDEQFKELVSAPSPEIEEYKEKIHPDDNRLNQIEINFLPGVMAVNSKSNLSYRDYKTTSPAWLLGAEYWLTPFMGIYGSYTSSISGDVISDPTTDSHSSAQHEWTEIGFDLRKYFGLSRKASSITFGMDYSDYRFKVPNDSTYREGLDETAVEFHLQSRVPVTPNYAWIFGAKLAPRMNSSEKNTGLVLSSGSNPQVMRIGFNVGGEFKMSRESQLIWQLSMSYEKSRYGDSSSLTDPSTGSVVNGVTIDSTTTFLQFGYRWGQ